MQPLLDHFHAPLRDIRPWTGFHSMWATKLAVALSRTLPDGWFAAPTVHWDIEVDVAAFEESYRSAAHGQISAVPIEIPAPTKTIDFTFTTDVVEVQVFRDFGELTLAGAVELISPANKDRPENRDAFVAKCDTLLRSSVGLVLVDIVTSRQANLHRDLMAHFHEPVDENAYLYLSSYRPLPGRAGPTLSVWYRPLSLGVPIPPQLLFLKNGPVVELPLEQTYAETCEDLKIRIP